jgi:hypothetical protein
MGCIVTSIFFSKRPIEIFVFAMITHTKSMNKKWIHMVHPAFHQWGSSNIQHLICKYSQRTISLPKIDLRNFTLQRLWKWKILLCDRAITGRFWIGNQSYWTLTDHYYK